MFQKKRSACILSAILILLTFIAGCSKPDGEETTNGNHPEYADVPLLRHDSTRFYKYDIRLPEIIRTNATLRDTLTSLTDAQQEEFITQAKRDSTGFASISYPWAMQVHYHVTDSTEHFISVLGEGYTYTGGAHGMPFHITLNYDREEKELIGLRDILKDSTALELIAERAQLELARHLIEADGTPAKDQQSLEEYVRNDNWLREGSIPIWSHYKNTLLQQQGLRIIFGAYQIGPYAIGTPDVEVPASVFQSQLKPEYKNWFTGNQ